MRQYWRQLRTPQHATWLPVLPPAGAFLELALIIGAIYLACAIFPGADLAALEPSPFWLPILLLSLQYGTVAGLIATAVSTGFYAFNGLPDQVIGENLFTYLLRIWALPILWIGVSLVLGQFRLRQIAVKQELKRRLEQRTAEAQALGVYSKSLEDRCHRLERQITSSGPMAGAVAIDVLSRFLDPGADFGGTLDKMREQVFPGARLMLFAATPQGLEVIAQAGEDEGPVWPKPIAPDHPLWRAIVNERRYVSVLDAAHEPLLRGVAHAAHPLFHPDTGRVSGMLTLEARDPSALVPQTENRLAVIGRFAALHLTEPRVVVDNTDRMSGLNSRLHRLTKGWRQLSWQQEPETAPVQPGSDDSGQRNQSRPLVLK